MVCLSQSTPSAQIRDTSPPRGRQSFRGSNGAKATGATAFSTFRPETATNLFPYRRKPRFVVSDTCKDLDLELVERVLISIVALRRSEVRIPSAPPIGVVICLRFQ